MCNRVENAVGPLPENWINLEPNDFDYGRYEPNIVAALYKAGEVFQAFCQARSLLIDSAEVDNQEPEGMGRTFRKATLLQAALMQYISCWDLSWQPLWFKYVEESNRQIIDDVDYYEECIERCRKRQLSSRLRNVNANGILEHIDSRDDDEFWSSLRDTYNYMKHRGTHHIQGIGENPQYAHFVVNGRRPHIIAHREFDVERWTDNLIRFHREFIDYFNVIIADIVPDDYYENINGEDLLRGMLSLV